MVSMRARSSGRHSICFSARTQISPHGETIAALPGEDTKATACRIAAALQDSVFAIQGPPGTGKTYTGARMICRLVQAGKKVGVTALSHKVISHLLDEINTAASEDDIPGVRCMQVIRSGGDDESPDIASYGNNELAWEALTQPEQRMSWRNLVVVGSEDSVMRRRRTLRR